MKIIVSNKIQFAISAITIGKFKRSEEGGGDHPLHPPPLGYAPVSSEVGICLRKYCMHKGAKSRAILTLYNVMSRCMITERASYNEFRTGMCTMQWKRVHRVLVYTKS